MLWPMTILLVFQMAGEIGSKLLSLPVPGPVIGMALMLVALATVPGLFQLVAPLAQTILGNLSLLFVPAGVGVVSHLDKVAEFGVGLAVALVVSTVLAIVAGVLTFRGVAWLMGDRA